VSIYENEDNLEEEPLPIPCLVNLAAISEALSASAFSQIKKARMAEQCMKEEVK